MTPRDRSLAVAAAALLAASPTVAAAKTVTAVVDARSMPWSPGANPSLSFDTDGAIAPKVLWGLGLISGLQVKFAATGSFVLSAGISPITPDGVTGVGASAATGRTYMPQERSGDHALYFGTLMGAFVDADGTVVGTPFRIGTAATVKVPDGAVGLSMGVNDATYADNVGKITVTVTVQEAAVTVETPPTP